MAKKIGIIGFGNMGSAIAERIKNKFEVTVFDKDASKTANISGIKIAGTPSELIKNSDTVVLAVKPQDFDVLLNEIKPDIKDRLVISIAAGKKTKDIEDALGRVRVIRVMPNIAAIVGKGISYICKGKFAADSDRDLSVELFGFIGSTFVIPEDLMHAATAIGGSGPGFWGYLIDKLPENERSEYESKHFIPELTSAAINLGLDKKIAELSAEIVVTGSATTASTLHISPRELTVRVASKGGTTEAGLEVLRHGGTLIEAAEAAARRSEELSKKE